MQVIKKVWGKEVVIVDRLLYTAKLLVYLPEGQSSKHHHEIKTETWTIMSGGGELESERAEKLLTVGMQITFKPNRYHRVTAGSGGLTIFEVSTAERNDTVVRHKGCESNPPPGGAESDDAFLRRQEVLIFPPLQIEEKPDAG